MRAANYVQNSLMQVQSCCLLIKTYIFAVLLAIAIVVVFVITQK